MEIEEIRSIFVELTKNYICIISKNSDENSPGFLLIHIVFIESHGRDLRQGQR